MSKFLFEDEQTVVFVGDSITDCARRAAAAPFGNGYVRYAIELITARYPALNLKYFNEGIGGNTVIDLQNRWHDDVLRHNPDWITVKIGVNDLRSVLRQAPNSVTVGVFEAAYRHVLTQSKEIGARLVLIDPFYIAEGTSTNGIDHAPLELLPEYIAVVDKMAREFDAFHVKTHELFQEQLQYRPTDYFSPEPVHPHPSGHHVIALGLLDVLKW